MKKGELIMEVLIKKDENSKPVPAEQIASFDNYKDLDFLGHYKKVRNYIKLY